MKQVNAQFQYKILRKSELLMELYVSTHVLLNWLEIVRLHHKYQKEYPDQYLLLKFEDLVNAPETCIKNVCQFLKVDYTEELLNQKVVNSSFSQNDSNNAGFNTASINRWKSYIRPIVKWWIELWTSKYLKEFDYN